MKVGDLVRHDQGYIGIITRYIPDIDDDNFVEVYWKNMIRLRLLRWF